VGPLPHKTGTFENCPIIMATLTRLG